MMKRVLSLSLLLLVLCTLKSACAAAEKLPTFSLNHSPSISIRSKKSKSVPSAPSILHIQLMKQNSCEVQGQNKHKQKFKSVLEEITQRKGQCKNILTNNDEKTQPENLSDDDDFLFKMDN